jgi:hypothetical protein
MKTSILTLSTLAFLSTTIFAETKPNVPAKEANQIFKAAGFSKTKHGWEGKGRKCKNASFHFVLKFLSLFWMK